MRHFTAIATHGDTVGIQLVTNLLFQGWEVFRVDASGGRFIYVFSKEMPDKAPPLLPAPASTIPPDAPAPRQRRKV